MVERRPARYDIDLSGRGHEVVVTATLPVPPRGGRIHLYMPRWAPGSYLVREFARHVDRIRATQGGAEVRIRKSGVDEWEVDCVNGDPLVVEYGLYAHELTVRTNYLAVDRALLAGAATFLRPVETDVGPIAVSVRQPAGWPTPECVLAKDGDEWTARDFDELVDAPIAAGPCTVADFAVRGVPHRIAVYGAGDASAVDLVDDVKATCEAAVELFGDIPCSRYLFIFEVGCGGGLEHADSCVCGMPALARSTPAEWRRVMSLVAHEYFHLWNVKRIRPRALGPFDYRREAHTPHLWVAEGLTSYYQHLLGLRAGLFSAERYLTQLAAQVLELESTPGRLVQSLEESSHDTWIKYYRPHENSGNSSVSYYGKGAVAGLVLDLEIRRRTGGRRCLDDVFRALWRQWKSRPDEGFTDEELRAAIGAAADSSMDAVVDEVARSAGELDVDSRLAAAGLELVRKEGGDGGYLGVLLRRVEGRTLVERVAREGPAWNAGLAPGEEIIALDGFRVDDADLRRHLDARVAGECVEITSAHSGRLRTVSVTLGSRPSTDHRFRKLAAADATAREVLRTWLGTRWEELSPLDEPPEDQRSGRAPRML